MSEFSEKLLNNINVVVECWRNGGHEVGEGEVFYSDAMGVMIHKTECSRCGCIVWQFMPDMPDPS